jgi:hypothetical protein
MAKTGNLWTYTCVSNIFSGVTIITSNSEEGTTHSQDVSIMLHIFESETDPSGLKSGLELPRERNERQEMPTPTMSLLIIMPHSHLSV